MARIAEPRDYWIAPEAIYITRNALGDPDRIQGNVAAGAAILCYMKGVQGLEYDNGHNYKSWPLSLSPTYFNSTTPKYIYVAIPKTTQVGTQAVIVFPSQKLDVYGMTEPTVDPETEEEIPGEQIGSTDYYYVWLQGILSASVDELGATQNREWLQEIQTGLLSSDEALASLDTDWYSYSQITSVVTFLKEIAMSAGAWFRNLIVGSGTTQGNLTGVATGANGSAIEDSSSEHIVTPSYLNNKFLRKDVPDTAKEKITFEKGAEFGDFTKDATGAALYQDDDGNWHCEADFLHARKKLTAKEVQIEEVSHIGGQQLLTAASMLCAFVVDKGDYYRCFFNKEASDGRKVTNKWKTGDQAYACTFNIEEQADGTLGNHYFWRLVTGTSNDGADTSDYEVDGETVNGADYHYIDLSKSVASSESDAPKAGDNIVQLGYRGTDAGASERQAAILMAGAGTASPYIREFTGIDSFNLPSPETQLKPGDNILSGVVNMSAGSTLAGENLQNVIDTAAGNASSQVRNDLEQAIQELSDDVDNDISRIDQSVTNIGEGLDNLQEDVDNLTTGNENLLRNSGFTGDYIDEATTEEMAVSENTPMYSDSMAHWTAENATVGTSAESVTGKAVTLSGGSLRQTLEKTVEAGKNYVFSFRGYGSQLTFSVGGYTKTVTLTSTNTRYNVKFQATESGNTFAITDATGTLMELQLVEGIIPNTDWINSPLDNDKALAYYQNLTYLANAIANASTQVLGGLILSQLIKVGNYRNGQMSEETGGMSGLYNSGNSPFLWGGGTMRQAFYTIAKYADNPNYEPSASELANDMAKFVVTHGGRAILNDIILRGYVYALGGVFRGNVYANGGIFNNIDSPNGNFKIDAEGNMVVNNATISGNMYAPLFVINDSNFSECTEVISGRNVVKLDVTGLNICLEGDWRYQNINIALPMNQKYKGAIARIYNNTSSTLTVTGVVKTNQLLWGTYQNLRTTADTLFISPYCYATLQCQSYSAGAYISQVQQLQKITSNTFTEIASGLQVGDKIHITAGISAGGGGYQVKGGTSASALNVTFFDTTSAVTTSGKVHGYQTDYTILSTPACSKIYAKVESGEGVFTVDKLNATSEYMWTDVTLINPHEGVAAPERLKFTHYSYATGEDVGQEPYIDENGVLRFRHWTRADENGYLRIDS